MADTDPMFEIVMMRPPLSALASLIAFASSLPAQDARPVPQTADSARSVEKGAQLRIWTGSVEASALIGRLEHADSQVVRIAVSGEEGDPRLKFALLGVETAGEGTGDSVIAAVPWRLIRKIDVAAGLRSRRVANTIYGSLIGAAIGGGAGAVSGALRARSDCPGGGTACGISSSAGSGMAIGTIVGGVAGALYGAVRRSFVVLWTPLPDRGRQLRARRPVPAK